MRPILDILTSRWCVSFIGIALLAGVVWFFAPLLPGFEDWPPRLALLAALLLAWGGGNALLDIRRRRRDAALTRGIASSPEADEEAQALICALADHIVKPAFIYRHQWRVGDLLLWDNCTVQHRAIQDYDLPQRRLMHRTTMGGAVPM